MFVGQDDEREAEGEEGRGEDQADEEGSHKLPILWNIALGSVSQITDLLSSRSEAAHTKEAQGSHGLGKYVAVQRA